MLRLQSICTLRRAAFGGAALLGFVFICAACTDSLSAQSFEPRSTLAPTVLPSDLEFDATVIDAVRGNNFVEAWQPVRRKAQQQSPSAAISQPTRSTAPTPTVETPGDAANSPSPITPAPRLALADPNPRLASPVKDSEEPVSQPLALQQPHVGWQPSGPASTPDAGDADVGPQLEWRPRGSASTPPTNGRTSAEPSRPLRSPQEAANTIGGRDPRSGQTATDRIARRNRSIVNQGARPKLTAPHSEVNDDEPLVSDSLVEDGDEMLVDEPTIATDDEMFDEEHDEDIAPSNTPRSRAPNQQRSKTDESESGQTAPIRIPPRDLPPLTQQQINLRNKIRRVLKHYYDRPLNTGNRGPWELMHAMLSFEVHSRVLQGSPNGDPITAVGWLCFNQPCRNRTLLYLNNDGELRARVGPALQGHQGQLLALLALSRVKSDYPIRVDGKELTIEALIEMEKATCYPRTELTFKLIGLQNYLDADATWVNDQGMTWNFERLVSEELRQPVRGAACGGMHRLTGLALGVKARKKAGLPVNGVFSQAERFVDQYQNYAYRLQNSDGSFSTEWFRGPGAESDIDRRLKTTGHTLEWLLYAGDEQHQTYYRTVRAVNYLANLMWSNRYRDWEAGPLGHAIHSLVLYDRLVFSPYDKGGEHPIAGRPVNRR